MTTYTDPRTDFRQTPEQLQALVQELKRVADSKRDYIVPASKLAMAVRDPEAFTPEERRAYGNNPDVFMDVAGLTPVAPTLTSRFGIRKIAHEHLSDKLGIPLAYYRRMQAERPGLLARNVNEWLTTNGKNHLVRTVDGDVRAVLGDTYRVIDNYDALKASLPHLQKAGAQILRADVTDERFYLRAFMPEWREVIKPELLVPGSHTQMPGGEDAVCPGVLVRNSEVGRGKFSASFFLFRFSCSNGLFTETSIAQVHSGKRNDPGELVAGGYESDETRRLDNEAFWSRVGDLVAGCFDKDEWRNTVEMLKGRAATQLDNPIEAVNNVVKAYDLGGDDVMDALLNELMRPSTEGVNPGLTVWGLTNAVTDLARKTEEAGETDKAFDLMRIGGEIMTFAPKVRELVRVR